MRVFQSWFWVLGKFKKAQGGFWEFQVTGRFKGVSRGLRYY